jgi:hypothetical protein
MTSFTSQGTNFFTDASIGLSTDANYNSASAYYAEDKPYTNVLMAGCYLEYLSYSWLPITRVI